MSLNLLASSKKILRYMKGPPGYSVIGSDIKALEPHVIAHFSQCPVYMKIYGPGANPNHCIYSYFGMHVPQYEKLFGEFYDLEVPSEGAADKIKKLYKTERDACKQGHLSMVYGGGPARVHSEFQLQGINMTLGEVVQLHKVYWKLFKQVNNYTYSLKAQWRRNGGYIITGRGTPHPIGEKEMKTDILNRMIQKTGHQFVMRWVWHITEIAKERGINMSPFVSDFHDATYWIAPKEEALAAKQAIDDGLVRLNEELQLTVTLLGVSKIGDNFGIAG